MSVLFVAGGGFAGAILRYLIDRRIQRRSGSDFPFGTLTVNVAGSLLLGLFTGLALLTPLRLTLATGLCGALTTYSTFGYETVRLVTDGARWHAAVNVVGTLVACLAAAGVGLLLGHAF